MKEELSLGEIIKNARVKKGMSQRALSRQTGVDNNTIAQIEKGTRKKPNPLSLKKLANVLFLDLRELMITAGYSLEDIEATIDPDMEEFIRREKMYQAIFKEYFKENDIRKTEWFKSQDKSFQKAILASLDEYFNR